MKAAHVCLCSLLFFATAGCGARDTFPWNELTKAREIPKEFWLKKGEAGTVQTVKQFQPADSASFGKESFPDIILGPPKGGGKLKGSLDVLSLGCGGSIVLEFKNPVVVDGEGVDFIIFENAFQQSEVSDVTFSEPAEVSVSLDGKEWKAFPCDPGNSSFPYKQCAGVRSVLAHASKDLSWLDPSTSGGDAFDLSDLGLKAARYIKIVDKSQEHPQSRIFCGAENSGFDLDAVAVIWGGKVHYE